MPDNRFWRDSSERLTFELSRVSAADYPEVCKAVVTAFGLVPDYESFAAGLDVVFMDYRRGEQVVEMAWDNWTGFTVVAKSTNSEPLVREMAAWLLQNEWDQGGDRA
jgi:hypothetical protein